MPVLASQWEKLTKTYLHQVNFEVVGFFFWHSMDQSWQAH